MVKYKVVLSKFGKQHFKGGNVIPMKKVLVKTFLSKKNAERTITKTLGSGQLNLYTFKKI